MGFRFYCLNDLEILGEQQAELRVVTFDLMEKFSHTDLS